MLAHTVFPSTWNVYSEIRYDWTPKEIGFSLGLVGVGAAVVQAGLMGLILDRIGTVKTALLGFGVNVTTLLFIGAGTAHTHDMLRCLLQPHTKSWACIVSS